MSAARAAEKFYDLNHLRKWDQKIDARRVGLIRKAYQLSERDFAARLGVGVKTLRNWEAGITNPTGSRRRLLTVYWKGFRPMKSADVIARTKKFWDTIPLVLTRAKPGRAKAKLVFEYKVS